MHHRGALPLTFKGPEQGLEDKKLPKRESGKSLFFIPFFHILHSIHFFFLYHDSHNIS